MQNKNTFESWLENSPDVKKYQGQHVAYYNGVIIEHSDTLDKLTQLVGEYHPGKDATLGYVPAKLICEIH